MCPRCDPTRLNWHDSTRVLQKVFSLSYFLLHYGEVAAALLLDSWRRSAVAPEFKPVIPEHQLLNQSRFADLPACIKLPSYAFSSRTCVFACPRACFRAYLRAFVHLCMCAGVFLCACLPARASLPSPQVWVVPSLSTDGTMSFQADSDSALTKGLAALLCEGLTGATPQQVGGLGEEVLIGNRAKGRDQALGLGRNLEDRLGLGQGRAGQRMMGWVG